MSFLKNPLSVDFDDENSVIFALDNDGVLFVFDLMEKTDVQIDATK